MAAPMLSKNCYFLKIPNFSIIQSLHTHIVLRNGAVKSRYMQKLLNKGARKKDKWYAPSNLQVNLPNSAGHETVKARRKYSDGLMRRSQVISSMLLEEVSGIIASGELGLYVTVLKVEVLPDMSAMKVYWEACGQQEKDDAKQQDLDHSTSKLRYELMNSQVIGRVPPVVFIKDYSTYRQQRMDELFENLDTGPMSDIEDENKVDGDEADKINSDEENQMNDKQLLYESMMKYSMEKLHKLSSKTSNQGDGSCAEISSSNSKARNSEWNGSDNENSSSNFDARNRSKVNTMNTCHANIQSKSIDSEDHDNCRSDILNEEADETGTPDNKSDFRQDLYGLQHDILIQKVTAAKLSSSQRRPVVESNPDTKWESRDWHVPRKIVSQEKKTSKRKQERILRQQRQFEEDEIH